MKLNEIIKDCAVLRLSCAPTVDILGITADSRKVRKGYLFVAVDGAFVDGHSFIPKAIEAGAVAVIYEKGEPEAPEDVCLVKVESSRLALTLAADAYYGHPSRRLTLVGITGTNGKTTTVTLLYELFTKLGHRCGLLSTIANYIGDEMRQTKNTTSDPITINSLLAEMVSRGCDYCFMEVSSIGVEQQRVSGLHFKAGIFSNLTRDHLDYHKTFAEYLRCKKLFFDNLSKDAAAIINIDDRNGKVMVQNCEGRIVSYSCTNAADHSCRIIEESFDGMQLRIDGHEVWTRLIGRHNAYNILACYCTALECGASENDILLAISTLSPAKGRLEQLRGPRGISVIIDYAHTPDALENVLKTLRAVSQKKELVCLFGCGGDRDKGKRPQMAEVAERFSDRIIVTSDNSRSERTEDIFTDIRAGFSREGISKALFISDRKEAIRTAIMTASDGAAILLAGKGHETYQIIGTETRHFDEREIVQEIFEDLT